MAKLQEYLQYFQKDDEALYIRQDFIHRLGELQGKSLKYLFDILFSDPKTEPREYGKLIKAFESDKPVRISHSDYQKQPIPRDLRWAVWERDNFTCQTCGSRRYLTVDHIHPESKGGELTMENAQTLCRSCNSRKGAR